MNQTSGYSVSKRVFDFVLACALLIIALIPMILVAMFNLIFLGAPVLFTQKRIGFKERSFKIYKFRTMKNTKDQNGALLPDEQRQSAYGNFLRSLSLDELPQIWNVLKGDISFVGPRPLLEEYVPLYSNNQRRRHDVMPGITGWAQIKGRNAISWKEKFELDVWYVDHQSFTLDMKIIFLTFFKILQREGVKTQDNGFMPKFNGNN